MDTTLRLSLCGAFAALLMSSACGQKDEGVGAQISTGDPASAGDGDGDGKGNAHDGGAGAADDGGDRGSWMDAEVYVEDPPDATCAATSQEAKQVTTTKEITVEVPHEEIKPVAIYLMLDRSSSMVGVGGGNPQSWSQATQAITQFTADPDSANVDVALGYFPPIVQQSDTSPTGPLCGGSACSAAAVSMRPAKDNTGPIMDSMGTARPPGPGDCDPFQAPGTCYTATPTECAMRGMSAFCKDHTAKTGEKCVGVLVTDGRPNSVCNDDGDMLAQLAADAAGEGTPIFAVGLSGADFGFLDKVATRGGTDCASTPAAGADAGVTDPGMDGGVADAGVVVGSSCDVSSGVTAFVAALNAIREKVVVTETHVETETMVTEEPIDCEWTIPPPPDNMEFDKDKVNVRFSATGKDDRLIGRVPEGEDCDKNPDAWHFDDPDDPTKILACDAACEEIKASSGARISIELGCETKILN